MKRPLFLAALCWLLVALFPTTRSGLERAREAAFAPPPAESSLGANAAFEGEALRRFPDNRRVQLQALSGLTGYLAGPDKKKNRHQIATLAAKLGDDPVAITLLLNSRLDDLKHDRNDGPLTSSGGRGAAPRKMKPSEISPRADWDAFIALARRGQALEPQNSYFSWMILYGLFATRRDDEARAELRLGARRTQYNDHSRDLVLNYLAVTRLMRGSPISVLDSFSAMNSTSWGASSKIRQMTRWTMECAIADRAAGRHNRALDTAFHLLQIGRIKRRGSYSFMSVLVANAVEQATLKSMLSPASVRRRQVRLPPGTANPRAFFQSDSLYYYAQNHGRTDITRFIDVESPELTKWRKLSTFVVANPYSWTGNFPAQMAILVGEGRARAMILRALPWILGLCALFWLISLRFRDSSGALVSGFWRGALAGAALLIVSMALDGLIAVREEDEFALAGDILYAYFGNAGLLVKAPSWAAPGWALALLSLGFEAAVGWQKRQVAAPIPLKTRFKTAFEAPEDGLSRFDFGWLLRLVASATGWLFLMGAFALMGFGFEEATRASGLDSFALANALLGAAFGISLILHLWTWRHLPRRRATIRLGWRLVSQFLLGAFVALSVLYALLAFAFLPLAQRYDRNFQRAMERGEVQIARAKLGI